MDPTICWGDRDCYFTWVPHAVAGPDDCGLADCCAPLVFNADAVASYEAAFRRWCGYSPAGGSCFLLEVGNCPRRWPTCVEGRCIAVPY
ncbi:MAG: hypothetical protein HY905_07265 [Deltaproteobacteria bacterium]|nr:hypothetical protein [Deltaproteobacteria bacterium]